MIRKDLHVKSNMVLSTKSVAELIQRASVFRASIWIEKDDKTANAKSMLGVLALKLADDCKITIIADGEDEEYAINELEEFIS